MPRPAPDLDRAIPARPGKTPPSSPVLEQIAQHFPPANQLVHIRFPRQLWAEFQELAGLHQRDSTKEAVVAIHEYVRRYRADLNAARRAAHREEVVERDDDAT